MNLPLWLVIFGGDVFGTVIEILLFIFLVVVIVWLIKWFMNRS